MQCDNHVNVHVCTYVFNALIPIHTGSSKSCLTFVKFAKPLHVFIPNGADHILFKQFSSTCASHYMDQTRTFV